MFCLSISTTIVAMRKKLEWSISGFKVPLNCLLNRLIIAAHESKPKGKEYLKLSCGCIAEYYESISDIDKSFARANSVAWWIDFIPLKETSRIVNFSTPQKVSIKEAWRHASLTKKLLHDAEKKFIRFPRISCLGITTKVDHQGQPP